MDLARTPSTPDGNPEMAQAILGQVPVGRFGEAAGDIGPIAVRAPISSSQPGRPIAFNLPTAFCPSLCKSHRRFDITNCPSCNFKRMQSCLMIKNLSGNH